MNLYIYSDESGVFDRAHNDFFVFGGIICFGIEEKEVATRKYSKVEKTIKEIYKFDKDSELKACKVSNKIKSKLFRSLNNSYKFCVLIKQKEVLPIIYENKKHKQRYLDYAYKIVLKKSIQYLVKKKILNPYKIENIYVYADEHQTATDGLYELKENLLSEFKYGTFNESWNVCYEPLFPMIKDVVVNFCDSSKTLLIRAADIVANHFYHLAIINKGRMKVKENSFLCELPILKIICVGESFFLKGKYKAT